MEIKRIFSVYWSATGNSRKVADTIAYALGAAFGLSPETRDFTLPQARLNDLTFAAGDLVVFVTPTYAGKLPNKMLPYIQTQTHGNGALAVPCVTFGNRSFDNALAELCGTLEANGFHTVAAGAFVGRHAFTDELAFGRPDTADKWEMERFAKDIAKKIGALTDYPAPISVPGDSAAPYYVPKGTDGQPAKFLKAKPQTDLKKCNFCGACARICPMGAIDPKEPTAVPGTCIKCQRCVRRCTRQAKFFDDPAFLSHVAMLEQNFAETKQNATFL
ncbi:MAG: EFR1 family ferrodoxin [Butyricicoccus sp.]|nr:EFR1 family ferrodoxin [Butyricicoccus sp.]MBQ8585347.1 EFR1 family ferrodoxin [Butyricicoccus sp.]